MKTTTKTRRGGRLPEIVFLRGRGRPDLNRLGLGRYTSFPSTCGRYRITRTKGAAFVSWTAERIGDDGRWFTIERNDGCGGPVYKRYRTRSASILAVRRYARDCGKGADDAE